MRIRRDKFASNENEEDIQIGRASPSPRFQASLTDELRFMTFFRNSSWFSFFSKKKGNVEKNNEYEANVKRKWFLFSPFLVLPSANHLLRPRFSRKKKSADLSDCHALEQLGQESSKRLWNARPQSSE